MKKICVLFILSLGFLIFCQPSFSTTLVAGDSLWVQTGSYAPVDFDGMTLFWGTGTTPGFDADKLDYYIWGPPTYSGVSSTSTQAPARVDLSKFSGENVVFQFHNTGPVAIEFGKAAAFDLDPPKPISGGESGLTDFEFYFAFYDNAASVWENRVVRKYIPGMIVSTPTHGNEFFDSGSNDPGYIRSDFQAVPEPGTLLLLASGIVVLAGGRRKFKKK